ncbi:MAG TPA: LysE family transporter [Crinalium sp.]|jgi:threonine/homoserine/homoserine lactone efflux protein
MDINFFLRGLVIGFSIAAPVGPIGVLCIRRTLTEGQLSGLCSGLGAATADAMYGVIAGFGLTFISGILVGQAVWFRIIGGAFLIYLGYTTFIATPAEKAAEFKGYGLLGTYISTVFLTLTNPATILSFAAVFAGLGLASAGGDYVSASVLVLGVFTGSALWWLLLSSGVSLLRSKFSFSGLQWLNRISGSILLVFGLIALVSGALA